jgi:bisphosphoglycerate-dependent phosphoglycerate mutase
MGTQGEALSMEQMTQMFMSFMDANARMDAPEIQRKEEANRITKCLQIILTKQGQFDGRKTTKYLKEYWIEITIYKLSAKVAIQEFSNMVEPKLKELITRFSKEANEDWKTFELKMKEEFWFENPDQVTAVQFMNWVHEKDKNLGPQELLRDFNRKYHQLSTKDVATINPNYGRLLVRVVDANLRLELDNALDQIAPDAEEITWEQAKASIQKITKQRKKREIGTEPKVPIIEVKKPTWSEVVKKEVKSETSETSPEIAILTNMISKLVLSIQALEGKNRPNQT